MSAAPDRPRLTPQLRRDMLLDLVGNFALAAGLWGWMDARDGGAGWLQLPPVFIALTATGVVNLLHLPARLRRLRDWRNTFRPGE